MTAKFIVRMQSEVDKLLQSESRLISEWTGCDDHVVRIVNGDSSVCHCIEIASMSYKKFDDCSISLHCHGFGNDTRQRKGEHQSGLEVWCINTLDLDEKLKIFREELPGLIASFFGPTVWSTQDAASCLAEIEWESDTSCLMLRNDIEKEGDRAVLYVASFPKELLSKRKSGFNYAPMMEIFFRRFARMSGLLDGEVGKSFDFTALSASRLCVLVPVELEEEFRKLFLLNKPTTL